MQWSQISPSHSFFPSHEAMGALSPTPNCFPLVHTHFLLSTFFNSALEPRESRKQIDAVWEAIIITQHFHMCSSGLLQFSFSPCLNSLAKFRNSHNLQIIIFQYCPLGNPMGASCLHEILGSEYAIFYGYHESPLPDGPLGNILQVKRHSIYRYVLPSLSNQ